MRALPVSFVAVVVAGCSAVAPGNVSRTATTTPASSSTTTVAPPAALDAVDAPDRVQATPQQVFVLGDSLTEGAEPWLAAAMAARGWELTGVDARVGRPVPEGLAVLRRRARSLPATVLVALGTNNLGASAADIETWVASARRIVGDGRRLVWVNISAAGSPGRVERVREINDALDAAGRRWRVDVLDWDAWARRNRIVTKSDGIHYEDGAYRLRALFYAAALPRPTPTL